MDKLLKRLQFENIQLRTENLKLLNEQYHTVSNTGAYQELLKSRQEAVLEVFNLRAQINGLQTEVHKLKELAALGAAIKKLLNDKRFLAIQTTVHGKVILTEVECLDGITVSKGDTLEEALESAGFMGKRSTQ